MLCGGRCIARLTLVHPSLSDLIMATASGKDRVARISTDDQSFVLPVSIYLSRVYVVRI